MSDGPYRENAVVEIDHEGDLRVGPIRVHFVQTDSPYDPTVRDGHRGVWRADRDMFVDNWGAISIGVWNGQRNGVPSAGIQVSSVLTRDQWNKYKQAVDECFDAFDNIPAE